MCEIHYPYLYNLSMCKFFYIRIYVCTYRFIKNFYLYSPLEHPYPNDIKGIHVNAFEVSMNIYIHTFRIFYMYVYIIMFV